MTATDPTASPNLVPRRAPEKQNSWLSSSLCRCPAALPHDDAPSATKCRLPNVSCAIFLLSFPLTCCFLFSERPPRHVNGRAEAHFPQARYRNTETERRGIRFCSRTTRFSRRKKRQRAPSPQSIDRTLPKLQGFWGSHSSLPPIGPRSRGFGILCLGMQGPAVGKRRFQFPAGKGGIPGSRFQWFFGPGRASGLNSFGGIWL